MPAHVISNMHQRCQQARAMPGLALHALLKRLHRMLTSPLQLQGACGTCASSTATMKMGIERALRVRSLRTCAGCRCRGLGCSPDPAALPLNPVPMASWRLVTWLQPGHAPVS